MSGFTLVELLIVIAVIALLAGVLVPNLLAARVRAQDRAAQLYSSAVYKALTAVLSSDASLSPSDVADGAFNCGPEAAATDLIAVNGSDFVFGWGVAPASVLSCDVVGDDVEGTIRVEITTLNSRFVSGGVD